jgi:hypothetical protein
MQDGQRWEGRGGLLEGGEEGHKMCCECVSTLCVLCGFALKAAVVMEAVLQMEDIIKANNIQKSALDHMRWNTLEIIALFSLRGASANKK